MKALYNGTKFRELTHAKWARFWDLIDLRWKYRPDVVDGAGSGGEKVVADFMLPDLKTWVVLISYEPTDDDPVVVEAKRLAVVSGWAVVVEWRPFVPGALGRGEGFDATNSAWVFWRSWPMGCQDSAWLMPGDDALAVGDHPHCWTACSVCRAPGIEWYGSSDRVCGEHCTGRRTDGEIPEFVLRAWDQVVR